MGVFELFGSLINPKRPERDDPDLIRIRQEKKILDAQRKLQTASVGFQDLIYNSNVSQQKRDMKDRQDNMTDKQKEKRNIDFTDVIGR